VEAMASNLNDFELANFCLKVYVMYLSYDGRFWGRMWTATEDEAAGM